MEPTFAEVIFTRDHSVAEEIKRLVRITATSVDAALYRLNNPLLARVLAEAVERGVRLRLVLDRGRYEEGDSARDILKGAGLAYRLSYGRLGPGSKMHHKFAILDDTLVVTGSYNWTIESEKENFDSLMLVRQRDHVMLYRSEFETLWNNSEEAK
ncbi:MAG: phospholipase D-like domain-containing protein [Deltaproteobacteria bacterium]